MRGTRASDRPSAGTRGKTSWGSRSSRQDAAVVPVIEAIIIALIVGGAMIFAASFQTAPPPAAAPGAEELEERSWDAFSTLDGMYYEDPSAANSSLSKAVRDALAGQPENLTEALATYLPPGAQFNVYLNNGYDRLTVYESRSPSGQTVGVSYPFEPRWRSTFTEPDLKYYGTAASPTLAMGVTNIPLFNSNVVPGEGHLVKAEAMGHQDWVPGALSPKESTAYHESGYATLLQGNADVDYTSASIYMTCMGHEDEGGRPCYAMDLTESTLDTYGPNDVPLTDDKGIPIVVENNGPATLPAGAKVIVELPVGLQVNTTWDGDLSHNWTLGVSGAAPSPQTVTARLGTDVGPGETAWFQINVTNTDDRYAFKHVSAYLESNHASSESDLLLKVNDRAPEAQSGGDTRMMLVSGPQPAGSKTTSDNPTGRWGMVLTNPVKETTLRSINLSLPDGESLIEAGDVPGDVNDTYTGTVYGPYGDGGWKLDTTANKVSFYFEGSEHELPAWSFAEMQFMVETDGRFTMASPSFPTTQPDTRYPGYTPGPMTHQTEPGVWWEEFPPQTGQPDPHAGYSLDHDTLTGRLDYRNHVISGEGTYLVEDLKAETESLITIQDAVRASNVWPDERRVPVGTTTTITLDASDLATVLSSELPVNDLTLHTNIYAPWGVDARIPAEVKSHSAQAGLQHLPNDLEVQDLDGDGLHDLVAAYTDGNVYGIAGDSGSPISDMTWPMPHSGEPTLLAKGRDTVSDPFYGVGTDGTADRVYAIDHSGGAEEKWNTTKRDGNPVKTLAINASLDVDGDGHTDVIHRQPSTASTPYDDAEASKLLLFRGDDGALFPGRWSKASGDEGVIVPGRSDQIGMGVIGPDALPGVYSNTAGGVGTNVVTEVNGSWEACGGVNLEDPSDCDVSLPISIGSSISVTGSGLLGFYEDGRQAFNYTGGDFIRLMNSERIPTGGAWTGILGAGGEGFLYGLSGELPVNPADGWLFVSWPANEAMDMANDVEGYISTRDGYIGATQSGGTNWVWGWGGVPLRGVGTIDAPYGDPRTAVVYAAGDSGTILRSTDRLKTVEDISGVGAVINVLDISLDDPDVNLDPSALETLDLTKVDFKDVLVESEDEAYFVGGGKPGTTADGNAYVVHTMDGGASLLVTEIACNDTDGSSLSGCAFNGLSSNGSSLWAVGTHGMVLAQNITGDMTNVSLRDDQPDPKLSGDAFVHLNLSNIASTELRDVQVLWTNKTDLSHYQNLRVDNGSGNRTLWSLSDDGTGLYVDGTFDATKGAGRGAALDLRGFDDNKDLLGDPDDNIWDGDATLKIGPFVNETTNTTPISAADFPAVNMTFVLTYGDGSQDLMTVGVGPETAKDAESPGGLWAAANRTGYTTTGCFGPPKAGCGIHQNINFTMNKISGDVMGVVAGERQVGPDPDLHQWPLYRLDEGTTAWVPQRNLYNDVTLYDAAIGTHDVDRWAAVGNGSRVFMSFNTGQNWTELPPVDLKDRQVSDLKTVDLTHPKVGYTLGGTDSTASFVTLGGYSEFGQVITGDVYNGSASVKDVIPDVSNLDVFVDGNHETGVEIQVQDGDGTWRTIINSQDGVTPVALNSPTKEIKLRWNMTSPSPWNRISPQAVGSLILNFKDVNNTARPPATLDLGKSWQWASGTGTLDLDTDRSMMRLVPAQVPWLTKLGNYTAADRGARPSDMDVSPNGWTAYVGTEGVYQIGGAYQSTPVGSDNTLYAFNITDGTEVPGFTPYTFANPIQFVRAHEDCIFVITDAIGEPARLHSLFPNGTLAAEVALGTGKTVIDAEIGDFLANGVVDIALATENDVGAGTLEVFEGETLFSEWDKSPAVKGFFKFDYPVDLNSMFGAHIIQTEFEWTMTTEDDRSITQSARIHNAFTVTPPNRKVALSPTYTLELIAWMEDWG